MKEMMQRSSALYGEFCDSEICTFTPDEQQEIETIRLNRTLVDELHARTIVEEETAVSWTKSKLVKFWLAKFDSAADNSPVNPSCLVVVVAFFFLFLKESSHCLHRRQAMDERKRKNRKKMMMGGQCQ